MTLGLLVGLSGDAKAQPSYSFTTIHVPGASSFPSQIVATGINASGQIVGSYQDATGFHDFLYKHGSFTTLDLPGVPTGINDSGQIVGTFGLLDDGSYTTLDAPGSTDTSRNGDQMAGIPGNGAGGE
jgi:probable HAF family extracellular repeat protein